MAYKNLAEEDAARLDAALKREAEREEWLERERREAEALRQNPNPPSDKPMEPLAVDRNPHFRGQLQWFCPACGSRNCSPYNQVETTCEVAKCRQPVEILST